MAEGLKRGDIVTVILPREPGERRKSTVPHPALVMQADAFAGMLTTTVLPFTTQLRDWPALRVTVDPAPGNGLRARSQVMIEMTQTPFRDRIGAVIGRLDRKHLFAVEEKLMIFLGLA